MPYKMLIDATHAEETRVVVVDGTRVEEFDFEAASRRQITGNIYLAKVTRVEPSLQAAFVDYGGNRHGFLAFSEIHPDYYQIPVADRQALLEEERAYARAQDEDGANRRSRRKPAAKAAPGDDAVATAPLPEGDEAARPGIAGMEVVELGGDGPDPLFEPEPPNGEAEDRPYAAVDHAAEIDDQIESIADEDVSDEIRAPRRPRARRYKIQEVVKVRQIMLVQVVKEERGNKGAALTTYLSLAGRYCVLMPNTARGGGISRKITNATDRKKLKEIAGTLTVPEGAGLIVRTAGAKRTKAEIKRDYEYLQRLWDQIRELTLKSIAPAPIYEEGNLIKRSIRDLYSRDIEEVLVEGDQGYRVAKDFMKMIMPSHAKNVRQYTDQMPLFARYQVESYLGGMFNPVVQLKSGGYIVIGITEALVSIDVNSGRATKEGSIEETALKTNLEAAEEIARQLRLRDLAGLIVIDFIDMEERKNNAAVEKKLKDKLKSDRARIQVGRISGFGLLEMSRQRLRPGMLEATTQPCPHCHGTGLIRSDDSLGLAVLRQIEEEGTRGRSREVLLKAPVGIVNFLINQKREHIAQIEARYGMAVRLEADPRLVSPDFTLEKFKTATRPVQQVAPVISIDTSSMPEPEPDIDEDEEDDDDEATGRSEDARSEAGQDEADRDEAGREDGAAGADGTGKRRRRRRRRRRGGAGEAERPAAAGDDAADAVSAGLGDAADASEPAIAAEAPTPPAASGPGVTDEPAATGPAATGPTLAEPGVADAGASPDTGAPAETEAPPAATPRRRTRTRRRPAAEAAAEAAAEEAGTPASEAPSAEPEAPATPRPRTRRRRAPAGAAATAAAQDAAVETPADGLAAQPAAQGLPEAAVPQATPDEAGTPAPQAGKPSPATTDPETAGDVAPLEPAPAADVAQEEPAVAAGPGSATEEQTVTATEEQTATATEGQTDTGTEERTSGTGGAAAEAQDGPTPDEADGTTPGGDDDGASAPRRRGWWAFGR